jgi:ankyrin repeat protein
MDDEKYWRINKKQKKYNKIDQDLLNMAYFGNEKLVKKYILLGADINFMEERDGWKGIHYAARWNNVEMLMHYIKAGCDVNSKTKNKETSLHKCSRWNSKNCAIILLEKGADPKIKTLMVTLQVI